MSERWNSSGDPSTQDTSDVALPRQTVAEVSAPAATQPVEETPKAVEPPKTGWSPTAWRTKS